MCFTIHKKRGLHCKPLMNENDSVSKKFFENFLASRNYLTMISFWLKISASTRNLSI